MLRVEIQHCQSKYLLSHLEKFVWEDNFLSNCNVIRQEFKWVDPLIELVKNNKLSRAKFMREISQLKMENSCDSFSEREQLLSPAEVEEFKINLKKSVLISFGRANKLTPDRNERITTTMNPRLTRMSIDHY